jgi:hypothetical protein
MQQRLRFLQLLIANGSAFESYVLCLVVHIHLVPAAGTAMLLIRVSGGWGAGMSRPDPVQLQIKVTTAGASGFEREVRFRSRSDSTQKPLPKRFPDDPTRDTVHGFSWPVRHEWYAFSTVVRKRLLHAFNERHCDALISRL